MSKPSLTTFGVLLLASVTFESACAAGHPPLAKAPFNAEQAKQFQQQWARHIGKPMVHANSIGMKMVLLPPGEFMMGTSTEDYLALTKIGSGATAYAIELPQHRVRITKPFFMGACEVTVEQFRRFAEESGYLTYAERGITNSRFTGSPSRLKTWRKTFYRQPDDHPVLQLCLRDCDMFCEWLSAREKAEGHEYYVPTEAEWEYACRAGTTTLWSFGGPEVYDEIAHEYAWMSWDRKKTPRPIAVGQKKPNNFGLFDMHGNVWEYVADWYGEYYFLESPVNDPPGPANMNELRDRRVMIRGGSYDWADYDARCSNRMRIQDTSNQHPHMGFRVAMRIKGVKGVPPAAEHEGPAVRGPALTPSEKIQDSVAAQNEAVTEKHPKDLRVDIGNGVGIEFVLIPPGAFMMGSATGWRAERPAHKVIIPNAFYLGKYETTMGQWEQIMGADKRVTAFKTSAKSASTYNPDLPMFNLTWDECNGFIAKLREKAPGYHFSLPTEAQWEYACRAGSTTAYCFGDDPALLEQYGSHVKDDALPFRERTLPDKQPERKPNTWGLFNMHGSVHEWCADWYAEDYYARSPVKDPPGPATGTMRVLRGGSLAAFAKYARSACRRFYYPKVSPGDSGFRLVIRLDPKGKQGEPR